MSDPVLGTKKLAFVWDTEDPFLFCVHHNDDYPAGNDKMGPAASLAGRNLGMDFEQSYDWRMYHGQVVPGFPRHPHRGFETVTIVRTGVIDHSDSLGAKARFGEGDVQWLTAGKGIEHSEMFPLRDKSSNNPLELFQIWLNLPAKDKMVEPYFTMLWDKDIPREEAAGVQVVRIAGDAASPPPPPDSWGSRDDAHVAIWTIKMAPGATWTLPASAAGLNRTLYFFEGGQLQVAERKFDVGTAIKVKSDEAIKLHNWGAAAEILMLQGKPIGEPVAHHGPFVMNTTAELRQAYEDYRRTRFGNWPHDSDAPVHPREKERFAVHADGREEAATG